MLTLSLLLAFAAPPQIRLAGDPPTAVEVTGVTPPDGAGTGDWWSARLRVVLASGTEAEIAARPALLGTATFKDGTIRFEPRFPFAPGVDYRATYDAGGSAVTKDFTIPKRKTEPAAVTAVYPSGDKLPENLLRLYIHFSKPMTRGDVYKYLKLVNETDETTVKMPFLELDEELWSPDRTRFTLLIDPGRIKKEVKPREDLGPALQAGKTFSFVVSKDWHDADGNPLNAEFRKTFTVTPPDQTAIDPAKWTIAPPNGSGPLTVTFDKPLDRALAERMITVVRADGKPVEAAAAAYDHERKLRLTAPAWKSGKYRIVIDTRLEDPSGNRVGEPFEVDVSKPVEKKDEAETVEREFEIK
jgi:hypothetical protein